MPIGSDQLTSWKAVGLRTSRLNKRHGPPSQAAHIITIIVVVGTSTWRMHVAIGRMSEERKSILA